MEGWVLTYPAGTSRPSYKRMSPRKWKRLSPIEKARCSLPVREKSDLYSVRVHGVVDLSADKAVFTNRHLAINMKKDSFGMLEKLQTGRTAILSQADAALIVANEGVEFFDRLKVEVVPRVEIRKLTAEDWAPMYQKLRAVTELVLRDAQEWEGDRVQRLTDLMTRMRHIDNVHSVGAVGSALGALVVGAVVGYVISKKTARKGTFDEIAEKVLMQTKIACESLGVPPQMVGAVACLICGVVVQKATNGMFAKALLLALAVAAVKGGLTFKGIEVNLFRGQLFSISKNGTYLLTALVSVVGVLLFGAAYGSEQAAKASMTLSRYAGILVAAERLSDTADVLVEFLGDALKAIMLSIAPGAAVSVLFRPKEIYEELAKAGRLPDGKVLLPQDMLCNDGLATAYCAVYEKAQAVVDDATIRGVTDQRVEKLRIRLATEKNLYKTARSTFGESNSILTPFVVYLYGRPGLAKSSVLGIVGQTLVPGSDIYIRDTMDPFWSGYNPVRHKVVAFDDFMQFNDPSANDGMEFMSVVTNVPKILNMPSVDDASIGLKGTKFRSSVVLVASNQANPNIPHQTSPDAFKRRRHSYWEVLPKEGVVGRNEGGDIDFAQFRPQQCACPPGCRIHPQVSPYEQALRFIRRDTHTGVLIESVTFGVWLDRVKADFRAHLDREAMRANTLLTAVGEHCVADPGAVAEYVDTGRSVLIKGVSYPIVTTPEGERVIVPSLVPGTKVQSDPEEDVEEETGTPCCQSHWLNRLRIIGGVVLGLVTGATLLAALFRLINGTASEQVDSVSRTKKIRQGRRKDARIDLDTQIIGRGSAKTYKSVGVHTYADKASKNMLKVVFNSGDRGFRTSSWGLALGSRTLLVPAHLIKPHVEANSGIIPEGMTVTISGEKIFTTGDVDSFTFNCPEYRMITYGGGVPQDMALIEMPKVVRPFPRITGQLMSAAEITKLAEDVFPVLSVSRQGRSTLVTSSVAEYDGGLKSSDSGFLIVGSWDVPLDAVDGDCGTLLCTVSGKIIGFLVAVKTDEAKSYYLPLYEEMLAAAIPSDGISFQEVIGAPGETLSGHGGLLVEKAEDKQWFPASSTIKRMTLKKADVERALEAQLPDYCHSILSNKDKRFVPTTPGETPLKRAVSKYSGKSVYLSEDLVEMVKKDYLKQIHPKWKHRKLTAREAVNGCQLEDGNKLGPMDLKTSPGLPYVTRGEKKPDLLTPEGDMQGKCKEQYDARLEALAKGEIPPSLWKDFPKDEILQKDKTRHITIPPFDFQIFVREHLGTAAEEFRRCQLDWGSAIGIDPECPEWHALACRFKLLCDGVMDLDFKNFDGSIPAQLIIAAVEILASFYPEHDKAAVSAIAEELVFTTSVVEDQKYQKGHGNPSGSPLTDVVNTIGLNLALRFAAYLEGVRFADEQTLVGYGDDALVGRLKGKQGLSFAQWQSALAQIGMNVTPADKTSETQEYREIEEVQFLKRKFVPSEEFDGDYVAVIDKATIGKILLFCKKDATMTSLWKARARAAVVFSAFHGERISAAVRELCKWYACTYLQVSRLELPTYEEIVARYWRGELDEWTGDE